MSENDLENSTIFGKVMSFPEIGGAFFRMSFPEFANKD